MSMDAKPSVSNTAPAAAAVHRPPGIRIFMWPKVIFLYPTAIVSLICWAGMGILAHNRLHDPTVPLNRAVDQRFLAADRGAPGAADATPAPDTAVASAPKVDKIQRFLTPQNLLGVLFMAMLAFNLLVMALDFPRFTILALILGLLFGLFFVLWLGSYFELELLKPIQWVLGNVYVVASRGFYLCVFFTLMFVFGIIYLTRWLDYWEILPNELLHHHGPLSDLERYSTMNLKFDKEIPDILEWLMAGSGRLVLHIPNVNKAQILDNVLFISRKEEALKRVMSRMEVRVTTDQEAGESD